jgi:ribulose-phosphate 3-epimerase
MNPRIVPSVLTADWGHLAQAIALCEGADGIHLDVMDGHFVPNLTFGAKMIQTVRALTPLPLDVHLMVQEPEQYFDAFAAAGATGLTIHIEAAPHVHRQVERIKRLGCVAGVALNPGTPIECIADVAPDLDVLLIMSVNPGFGGQQFIPHALDKVRRARRLLDGVAGRAALEVDGGVGRATIGPCWQAGADTFVTGNAVFAAADPRAEIAALRSLCAARA